MATIICAKPPNRTAENVNILCNMIARNHPDQHEYICLTDDATDIHASIECLPYSDTVNFAALPKGGINETFIYFHIDTLITGPLDELFAYAGDYGKTKAGNVAIWRKGSKPEMLDDIYPHIFTDYALCADIFPQKAKVIRCAESPANYNGWPEHIYKINGGSALELKNVGNTSNDVLIENIMYALQSGLPFLEKSEPHDGIAAIVGGGPSLAGEYIPNHYTIFATNNSWRLLPRFDYHVMVDARPDNAAFVPPEGKKLYATQCHKSTHIGDVTLWNSLEAQELCDGMLVAGGSSVGLKAIVIAYLMGFRKFHLYGLDSSYAGGNHHAYAQPLNDGERVLQVVCDGKEYEAAAWMVTQVEEFKQLMPLLVQDGCEFSIHGTGLLPDVAKGMACNEFTAVYDLASSPPTYEFITFLAAAEEYRKKNNYTGINIVFAPGPNGGFRDDNLPPDVETRKSMLWRVCVPACNLLPSVRNVSVLAHRQAVDGPVFPEGWEVNNPVPHYGMQHITNGIERPLTATKAAKDKVNKLYGSKFVTITLREAPYWPERNSKRDEWMKAADAIRAMSYGVVIVEDTETTTDVVAWDIDFRAALYQKAVCNLGISNGPMILAMLCDAKYMIFRPVTDGHTCVNEEFMARVGLPRGSQLSDNGVMVWEDDTADVIIKHFTQTIC